jgi:hypothetical protein
MHPEDEEAANLQHVAECRSVDNVQHATNLSVKPKVTLLAEKFPEF